MQAQKSRTHRERIVSHLTTLAENGGAFIKSKDLTDATDLSAKEVGHHLSEISSDAESDIPVEVERWSYTNSTTWRVTPV